MQLEGLVIHSKQVLQCIWFIFIRERKVLQCIWFIFIRERKGKELKKKKKVRGDYLFLIWIMYVREGKVNGMMIIFFYLIKSCREKEEKYFY